MVTLQILVLSFLVRVRVSQLVSIFHSKDAFFISPRLSSICPRILPGIKKKTQSFRPGFMMNSMISFTVSLHQITYSLHR